ncbi:MAG: class I SAM-dependent methyltransferase [Bacteroidales bacterium]|jgi:ubiquinone/menaquinone biosynthesis C-methylase UbiE
MNHKTDTEKAKRSCVEYYDHAYHDYYDKFQDELDKKPYDKDFLTRFISLLDKNDKILDIGCCSTAQQARFFRDNGFHVTSIDLSEKCIATARQHFPGIDFIQMDMLNMNFDNDSFHAINAFYSIIHIPDEKLNGLFSGFNRILKLNGKIAITVHAGDFYGYYNENETPVFFRTFDQNDLKHYLDKYGFNILEIEQRQPIYDFEFQSERIYLIAGKK